LIAAITRNARRLLLFDMDAVANDEGAILSAVMLGALAGCECLPIPIDAFEAAIRAEGKAVGANLRAFEAAVAAFVCTAPRNR
jgi:indolepyruvate ferredoxin oxidoreductase, beta subunit